MTGSELLVRRVVLITGLLMAASLCAELIMAVVDNTLKTPVGRFLSINSMIGHLGQVVWALALVVTGLWAAAEPRTQRWAAWLLVGLGVLLLVPPVFLWRNLDAATAGLASGGLLRAKVQFIRSVVTYLTLTALFVTAGRFLARSARAVEGGAA